MTIPSLAKHAAIGALLCAMPLAASAQNLMGVDVTQPGDTAVSETVTLNLSKSTVVELSRPAADLVLTNPLIADAVVQTRQRLIFRGIQVGQTNAFVFDDAGNTILNLEINVEPDTARLSDIVSRYVPDARVSFEMVNGSIVIDGIVDNIVQADQVIRLVTAYLPDDGTGEAPIVNLMSVAAKDQVMLEVRIVEMQRTVIKQLGINLTGASDFGDLANLVEQQLFADIPDDGLGVINTGETVLADGLPFSNRYRINGAPAFGIQGGSLGGLSTELGYANYVGDEFQSSAGVAIDALERIGVVRTLAEPNITAISGETARFLAGGEFPVPVGTTDTGAIEIEFKQYGVGLAFTPTVMSEGRISLKISTEISELSTQGAFEGQAVAGVSASGDVLTAQTITIPALTVRRAESTIELPSGGSTMLAGLIQTRSQQSIDQLPGLKKLPILGALFQSRDFQNEETEMVVIATPYLVDPVKKSDLRTPADGYVNATDPQTIFFGKLNAQYAQSDQTISASNYQAPVGFIEE